MKVVVEIVSPIIKLIRCKEETLLLLSPNIKLIKEIELAFSTDGFSEKVSNLLFQDDLEVTYIFIRQDSNSTNIKAFRSITSHYELFYYIKDDEIVITDHFKNILSYLPVEDRKISSDGFMDLVLFQRNFGKETLVKLIERLGHGELLEYIDGSTKIDILQKVNASSNMGQDYRVIDSIINDILKNIMKDNSINTLSGGIDSTLLQTYMPNNKSISVKFNFTDYQQDVEYAIMASKLLNTNHTFITLKEEDYFDEFKNSIITYGLPANDLLNIENSQF
jgi:asparagine synthetase B (glutamine-hydrolysing)